MKERQKTCALEIQAVLMVTAILTSDEAHFSFGKTFNPPALVQKSASTDSVRRDRAAWAPTAAAKGLKSPWIALWATQMKLAAFTQVTESTQKNIDDIAQQKEDEIKWKDYRIEELRATSTRPH